MKKYLLIMMAALLLCLLACSGNEDDNLDKDPPSRPTLRPHIGDTGDPPYVYLGQQYEINDENNGIDTVPDEDWIRIMWEPFIDTDLSHIKIFRYDHINETVLVDSIAATAQHYLDSSSDLFEGVVYSYYIDLVDMAGNVATSDTVSYALLGKCIPFSPANGATISPTQTTFSWYRSGVASRYRLLLMDEYGAYKGHHDLWVTTEEDPLSAPIPTNLLIPGTSMRWRVDAFEPNAEMDWEMGSESNEFIVHIQ